MRAAVTLAFLVLSIALPGCTLLPERPPSPALHDFGPPPRSPSSMQGESAAVSVTAPEWLLDDQIRYRLAFADPTRVRYYGLDRWMAPPPSLLAQRLASGLTGRAQMHIRLLDFEQVFDSPTAARVVMRFQATVKPDVGGSAEREQTFSLSRPCPTADARGAVTAFAKLVEGAVGTLQDWLAERRVPPTDPIRAAP